MQLLRNNKESSSETDDTNVGSSVFAPQMPKKFSFLKIVIIIILYIFSLLLPLDKLYLKIIDSIFCKTFLLLSPSCDFFLFLLLYFAVLLFPVDEC